MKLRAKFHVVSSLLSVLETDFDASAKVPLGESFTFSLLNILQSHIIIYIDYD